MPPCEEIVRRWWQLYPPVGTFIAVLSVVAALVPLFRPWDKISKHERAAWTFLMFVLVGGELRTIYLDRDEHDLEQAHARCEQLQSFQAIETSSQSQFQSTMREYANAEKAENRHFEQLLREEGRVFNGMQRNTRDTLDALTGGNSYTAIMPLLVTSDANNAELPLMVSVSGKNTLYDVTIEMQDGPLDMQAAQYMATHIKEYLEGKVRRSVHLPAISTTYSQPIGLTIHPGPDKINQYNFWTFSRNKLTRETLFVRFNQAKQSWEMSWKIYRDGTKPIDEVDFPDDNLK